MIMSGGDMDTSETYILMCEGAMGDLPKVEPESPIRGRHKYGSGIFVDVADQ